MRVESSEGNQYIEWLASGRAPCQATASASVANEVRSLRDCHEFLLRYNYKQPSHRPAKQLLDTHDISLARAVLQGEPSGAMSVQRTFHNASGRINALLDKKDSRQAEACDGMYQSCTT